MNKLPIILGTLLILVSCGGGSSTPAASSSSIAESSSIHSESSLESSSFISESSAIETSITIESSEDESSTHSHSEEETSADTSSEGTTDSFTFESSSEEETSLVTSVHEHNYVERVLVEPGCETEGKMLYECSCGDSYETPIGALGHDYGEWITDVEPSCDTEGHKYRVCSRDTSHIEEETLDPLGHDYGEWITDVEPSCENEGHKYRVCSRDTSHIEEETLDPLGHDWSENRVEPTCTEDGYVEHICERDATHNYIEHLSALGHDYGDWITDVDPTCIAKGHKYRVCSRDSSHVEEESLPLIDHIYVDDVCTMCGRPLYSLGLNFELSEDESYYIITGIGTCKDTALYLPSVHEDKPVKEIKADAFKNVKTFNYCDIPGSIEIIGDNAFVNSSLTKVDFHEGLRYIGKTAFALRNLAGGFIPETVEMLGTFAFNNSGYDYFSNNNDVFSYVRSKTNSHFALVSCRYWNISAYSTYTVPDDVEFIAHGALRDAKDMKALVIPASVKRIGQAFTYRDENAVGKGSSNLTRLTIPFLGYDENTPYSLSYFFGASTERNDHWIPKSVTEVTINGDKCKTLPAHAFAGDYCNVTDFTLANSIETIEEYAFAGCNKINKLYIPPKVTKLPYRMFSYGKVSSLYMKKGVAEFETGAFDSTSYGTLITNLYYEGSEEEFNEITNLENSGIEGRVGTIHYNQTF